MKDFTTLINNYKDGHVHLFDASGLTPIKRHFPCIGFMDIWFHELSKYTEDKSEQLYNKYLPQVNKNNIILSTAPDPDQVIHIYESHKEVIKGFGELKCYDYSFATNEPKKLPFKDLKWVEEICNYNDMGLPVYIHYSLDEGNVGNLIHIIEDYPHIPFIICHCGVGTRDEYGFSLQGTTNESFKLALNLALKYDNVYLDISYTAYDALKDNLDSLQKTDKFLLGTDINPQQFNSDNVDGNILYKTQIKNFKNYYNILGKCNEKTIEKLFKN